MMGDDFWLGCRALSGIMQDFGGTAVQSLPAALEQAVVGRILDQSVLETMIVRPTRPAPSGNEEVRVLRACRARTGGEGSSTPPTARNSEYVEISSQDGADLHATSRASPSRVEPRSERSC